MVSVGQFLARNDLEPNCRPRPTGLVRYGFDHQKFGGPIISARLHRLSDRCTDKRHTSGGRQRQGHAIDGLAWTADDRPFLSQCGTHPKADTTVEGDDARGKVIRKYHCGFGKLVPDLLARTWKRFSPVVNEVIEQGEISGCKYDCIVIGHDDLRKQRWRLAKPLVRTHAS
jgi:hypothetical protein